MNNKDTIVFRIRTLIDYMNLSQHEFARRIRIDSGNLSNILTGKRPAAEGIVNKIALSFDNVSRDWLLTGEGSMFKDSPEPTVPVATHAEVYTVPVIPISAQGGSLNDFVVSVRDADCEKMISPVKGADFVIPVCGDSMYPEYPSGSQVLVKRINEHAFINWGHAHVLDTCNGIVLKKLLPVSEDPSSVLCCSINPEYPPFTVSLKDVYGIYRVIMMINIK